MKDNIEKFIIFLKENKFSNNVKNEGDNLTVGGSLYLSCTNITELPDNLTVEGNLNLRNTNITELPDNLTVEGNLNLRNTNIKELPDNLTVGGFLDLRNTNIKELPDNLTVGGSLYLSYTNITELSDNLTVGEFLDLSGTNIKELPDNLTVGEFLDLSGTNIKELPDNLTVGGNLNLSGTNIKELPDNLTVGGFLDLRNTNIKELPDNLTVGGNLNLSGTNIMDAGRAKRNVNKIVIGYCKERNYIYFDNILWGNVKSIKKRDNITIYKTPLGYCVVENSISAHGKTLKKAMEDLTFKKLKDVDVSEIVAKIKETGKVTRSQYRIITGACQMGTDRFCNKHNIQDLEEIELTELRKILIDDYGAKEFWKLIDGE